MWPEADALHCVTTFLFISIFLDILDNSDMGIQNIASFFAYRQYFLKNQIHS